MTVDRRQFLHDTAALAASITALQAASAQAADETATTPAKGKKTSANDAVRIAVIGVRGRGMEHIRGFTALDDARITTLCDVDRNVIGKGMKAVSVGLRVRTQVRPGPAPGPR